MDCSWPSWRAQEASFDDGNLTYASFSFETVVVEDDEMDAVMVKEEEPNLKPAEPQNMPPLCLLKLPRIQQLHWRRDIGLTDFLQALDQTHDEDLGDALQFGVNTPWHELGLLPGALPPGFFEAKELLEKAGDPAKRRRMAVALAAAQSWMMVLALPTQTWLSLAASCSECFLKGVVLNGLH